MYNLLWYLTSRALIDALLVLMVLMQFKFLLLYLINRYHLSMTVRFLFSITNISIRWEEMKNIFITVKTSYNDDNVLIDVFRMLYRSTKRWFFCYKITNQCFCSRGFGFVKCDTFTQIEWKAPAKKKAFVYCNGIPL